MKKIISFYYFICIMLTTVMGQDTVKVGAFNFYPGIFKDTDGAIKGFYVDALNEIAQKENIKFVYIYGTWDEGLNRIKNGEVDLLTSVAITEERLTFMEYTSTPLLTVWSEVYVTQKSEIRGILDLEGKSIAIMKSDFNGVYLIQLTEKLNVNCSFVESDDFEGVFQLIKDNKVDAGVVNNTFGVPKSADYGLLSSGIIFNPFDIFITVKKDSNEKLLQLIDKYLHHWKHDRSSVFNDSRQKWSHGKVGTIQVFPKWIKKGIYSAFLLVLALIIFIVLLRYRVNVVTKKEKYSKRLFETFMENTPAYVYIKDKNLNHIYSNKMVNMVHNAEDKNRLISAKTVFEPEVAKLVEKEDASILCSEIKQTNLKYQCKLNGKNIWLDDYKFHLKLPNGEPAVAGVSFDITKLKETEFELINAKEKAEESDRLKSAFLSNMSHEIRTPMNGILGFTELLLEPDLNSEEKDRYIKIVHKSGQRMLNTVTDIVEISKIEAGLVQLNFTETDVNGKMEELFRFFKPEADKKGIKLSLTTLLPEALNNTTTDQNKLYSILTNLIKNAIKYTDEGTIEFGCKTISSVHEPMVRFYVKDTGIGIPKHRQEAIFDRFIQADITDARAFQGSGLGLAISKSYVEMLGGSIWVESIPDGKSGGKGSTFYFTLPLSKYAKEKTVVLNDIPVDSEKNKAMAAMSSLKIMIAEDDETSRNYISLIINDFTTKILEARTGIETVELCRNTKDLDLILMDIRMPIMNGYEATRLIREFNKEVIIIAQTAFALSGDREKAIEAGCNDYISKPINKNKLLALVQKYFGK